MKKTHLVAVLLAATFMVSSVPVQAAQEGRVKKTATAAKKQFRTSIDRFKRCMRGKCTRWEAAKVARDVGITAVAVIAAMYVTGGVLKKAGGPVVPELYSAGEALQAPVGGIVGVLKKPVRARRKARMDRQLGEAKKTFLGKQVRSIDLTEQDEQYKVTDIFLDFDGDKIRVELTRGRHWPVTIDIKQIELVPEADQ
ncbi:hypothetical protein E3J61_03085 [Candidatus Dependentiae bacterium]|nr:MAG: hypothetical protein E3J61_03085 [Candidatus Dependentiae bacterium]